MMNFKAFTKRHIKKAISLALAATMAISVVSASALATSDTSVFPNPTAEMSIDSTVMTTTSQRAASEIPLVFGVNVIAGSVFAGYTDMAGSTVSRYPDPYVWNYNYKQSGGTLTDGLAYYNSESVSGQSNGNGLYSSGGGNQVYTSSTNLNVDVFFGFNTTVLGNMSASYNPVIADVQTGSVTSRLYSWTEMGYALNSYKDSINKTTRNSTTDDDSIDIDPYAIGINVEQFSAGIPYYIASLIADEDNGFNIKKAAYVSYIDSSNNFTCADPATLGNVEADVFAEVGNFEFIDADVYTLDEIMAKDVDIIILGASGYTYTGNATTVDTSSTDKTKILATLSENYSTSDIPLIMDSATYGIKISNNGYNYSPITCMFLPYIQAYAYMDELAVLAAEGDEVAEAINPMAMFRYMVEEFFGVNAGSAEAVSLYYIGSAWDAADGYESYDLVPDTTSYTYSKDNIEEAIKQGIEYAISGDAESNGNVLLPAYRDGDTAYAILTGGYLEDEVPDGNYIAIQTGDDEYQYIDLDALSAVSENYENIVNYYTSTASSPIADGETGAGAYNYGYSLNTLLQNYYDHMTEHVWEPVLGVEGTYGSELSY